MFDNPDFDNLPEHIKDLYKSSAQNRYQISLISKEDKKQISDRCEIDKIFQQIQQQDYQQQSQDNVSNIIKKDINEYNKIEISRNRKSTDDYNQKMNKINKQIANINQEIDQEQDRQNNEELKNQIEQNNEDKNQKIANKIIVNKSLSQGDLQEYQQQYQQLEQPVLSQKNSFISQGEITVNQNNIIEKLKQKNNQKTKNSKKKKSSDQLQSNKICQNQKLSPIKNCKNKKNPKKTSQEQDQPLNNQCDEYLRFKAETQEFACQYCLSVSHVNLQCPAKSCYKCCSFSHIMRECKVKGSNCPQCNKIHDIQDCGVFVIKGHINYQNIKQNDIQCFRCGEYGHFNCNDYNQIYSQDPDDDIYNDEFVNNIQEENSKENIKKQQKQQKKMQVFGGGRRMNYFQETNFILDSDSDSGFSDIEREHKNYKRKQGYNYKNSRENKSQSRSRSRSKSRSKSRKQNQQYSQNPILK